MRNPCRICLKLPICSEMCQDFNDYNNSTKYKVGVPLMVINTAICAALAFVIWKFNVWPIYVAIHILIVCVVFFLAVYTSDVPYRALVAEPLITILMVLTLPFLLMYTSIAMVWHLFRGRTTKAHMLETRA